MTTDEGQAAFSYYTWNNGGGFVDENGDWALNSDKNVEALNFAIGLVNGLLISVAKLPAFIATLGTMIIARGVAQIVNGNMNTNGIYSDAFKNFFYYGRFLGIYTPIWIAIVLFAFFAFILSKTALGRHVYALGSNYEAARLSGVNVAAAQTKVYVISSFLAGVVGLILTAQSGMGSMDAGSN